MCLACVRFKTCAGARQKQQHQRRKNSIWAMLAWSKTASSPREDRKTIIAARRRPQNRKTDNYYILSCHRRCLKQTESKTAIMYRTFEKKKDAVDPRYPSLSLPTTGSHNFHRVKTYIDLHLVHIDFWQQWFSLHLSSVDWLSSWQLSYQPVIRPTRLH